ncbi:MAG: phage tail assembly chaperone [Roseicyclus sp.]|uniref:rcc01693 family protein n=1 Tax=Boseongicola sp. H5 TaxID=2763261 RepID=UPI001B0E3AF2|nr:rcc01693 family protein [Boseongicola sp. H5]MBO6603466.1 phage tail assembly chaperone [Roseicyclus sp.]MBO6626233.1 phage tail assembly chaperone [Roseicyclus sp.]MBO6921057.1 phage tail assembly chaperone [Roseicyclus sp.]
MKTDAGFDWPGLMRAGLQGLGLTPDQFWALTPAELLMMLGEGQGPAPMGRAGLEALAARFPDTTRSPEGET